MELHLFDFDGTLFHSPAPPDFWKKGYWWNEAQSLHPPCVPLKPGPKWWNAEVVSKAKQSISDPNIWAFLCTGRDLGSFSRYRVPELLEGQGLLFDELYLKDGGKTEQFKVKVLSQLIRKYPFVTKIQIWEDRHDHLNTFCSFVENQGIECEGHAITRKEIQCDLTKEPITSKISYPLHKKVVFSYLTRRK